jgi:hypothetical protein
MISPVGGLGRTGFSSCSRRGRQVKSIRKVAICTPERHPTVSADSEHVPSEKDDASPSKIVTTSQSDASSPQTGVQSASSNSRG